MKVKELFEIIEDMKNDESLNEYWVAGVRFEDKERQVGEVIEECSKHNINREDERDFPEFGTGEYEDMFELDGVSSWDIERAVEVLTPSMHRDDFYGKNVRDVFIGNHCYIIAGNYTSNETDSIDEGEVVIEEPTVIKVVY